MSGLDGKGTNYPNGVDIPAGKFFIDETAVTSTAAEINNLAGVTAGTVTAGKAVVVDANKRADALTVGTLSLGAGAGTSVTSTAAELNTLAGVTAGTASASKALVLGASKEIATITTATITTLNATNVDAGASGVAGTVDVFPATAAKGKLTLSVADQTGDTTVTVRANAMGQATQVNIADPGAAASYVAQSTAALTLAEVDVLDGVVAGTASASKAAVLGATKNLDTLSVATLLATTSATVGGGTAITKIVVYSQSLDVASVAANTTAEQTFTVTGLTTADKVFVNKPSLSAGLGIVNARVSAADTLAITFVNATGTAIDPAAETYAIVALRS